jgi:pimeloyl-ACP methyl ester carboxylesterase
LSHLYTLENRLTFKPTSTDHGALPPTAESVEFGNLFGLHLHGAFVPAPKPRSHSPKVILFAHGNRYNITKFQAQYDLFSSLGISFLTFDYPGYGRSAGSPSEASAYCAVRAAYSYLIHQRGFQPDEILIYGLSLGAAICAELLLEITPKGFIAECPFTNTWTMAKHLYPLVPVWGIFPNRFRNDHKFTTFTFPVLFIHGTADSITPFLCSQVLYESTPSHNKRLYLIEGAGHNNCLEIGGADLEQNIREWINSLCNNLPKD